MTREEAEKCIKSQTCKDCGIYLGGGKCSDNCKVIEIIKTLEQEQPKKGYWIDCYLYYKCSECEEISFGSYRKICPNCKAKMEGVRYK